MDCNVNLCHTTGKTLLPCVCRCSTQGCIADFHTLHSSRCLPVMPSFLSRIRYRGSSTQHSAHSESPQHTPIPPETTSNLEAPVDPIPSPLFGLKIRPDLDSLLESYETEDKNPHHQNKASPAVIPQPSIQDGYRPLSPNPNTSRNVLIRSPELTSPTTPVSTGQPKFPTLDEAFPLSGTFGRQQSPLANLGSTGSGLSHHKAPTRSRSLGDPTHAHQILTSVQGSGLNLAPVSQLPLSGTFARSSSTRSLPDKKRRIDRHRRSNTRSLNSLRTNRSSSPATPRQNRTPPSVVHQSRPDSPRTFGHPTPPHPSRIFDHHESPPPPLPPLYHPELTPDVQGSKPATFGGLHELPIRRRAIPRKRSKTLSVDSRRSSRRSSAEWSSIQATEGVLTNSNSWQAQVSREILRLSFGEAAALSGAGSAEDSGNNRDASHVAVTQRPRAETFVSPHLSLGSPPFLQGQLNTLYAAYPARLKLFTLFSDPSPPPSPSEFYGGDQAVVTGDEHNQRKRMTEQGTPTPQVANNPSDIKGKQPLKSSLRASSSTPRYSAISTVLAAPTRSDNQSSESGVSKGKRKADDIDQIPPDQRSLHATFAVPEDLPCESPFSFLQVVTLIPPSAAEKRTGPELLAPSSFRAKRARLSTSSYSPGPSPSRASTSPNVTNTGTWTSTTSSKIRSLSRQQSVTKPPSSKTNSYRSDVPSEKIRISERYERARSMSQLSHTSIPVSALVSPRVPSVSRSLTSAYHMRDPKKPPRVQPTSWGLRFRTEFEDGSPIHAWFFFLGFILFPIWWLASVWQIPQTRSVGGSDVEKAVTLDDPQVEHGRFSSLMHFPQVNQCRLCSSRRCEGMAKPLPHHGRRLSGHLHPIHCACRNFRSLTSRSFLTTSFSSTPPLVIDNSELDHLLTATFDALRPSHSSLGWLWFHLTLLEAPVIRFPVFIAYYELYRTDDNGMVSNSVVYFHSPSLPPHSPAGVPSLESTHHQT